MASSISSRVAPLPLGPLPVLFAASAAWLAWLVPADVTMGDSGEIGSASYVLGVAHPTGFPFDLLLLRAFVFLPFGSIPFRQNSCVALVSAAAVTAVAAITLALCARIGIRDWSARVGAVLGVAALLTFRTFLGTALGVEVYSTALLLTACAALAVLGGERTEALIWPLLGLSCGAHVVGGLLMLPLVAAVLLGRRRPLLGLLPRVACVLATALVIAYLPLAARREPPLDWGDPSTLSALFAHLTAARIRSSFAHEMFGGGPRTLPSLLLASQLSEHAILFAPALLGGVALFMRARRAFLVLALALTLDLAYAVWINPMGIADRQLGHASGAILAIFAALGVADLCARSTRYAILRWLAPASALLLAAALCTSTRWPTLADGYVLGERHGSGGPASELPPRSVYLCTSDSACASGLWSAHVEHVRPDLVVMPAQHLWDHAVLRKLRPRLRALHLELPTDEPSQPQARAALAARMVRELVARAAVQPVLFESDDPVARASRRWRIAPAAAAPLLQVLQTSADPGAMDAAISQTNALLRARFGPIGPTSTLARDAWCDAYGTLGKSALLAGDAGHAVLAFRRAVATAPEHASNYSNLGVALEAHGDLLGAFGATKRAIDLDPTRATAWANLARLSMRIATPEDTQKILAAARSFDIHDPRLERLASELEAHGVSGSTEK